MTRGDVAAKVAANKQKHPERFCPVPRCLWRTGGGRCPRHSESDALENAIVEAVELASQQEASDLAALASQKPS